MVLIQQYHSPFRSSLSSIRCKLYPIIIAFWATKGPLAYFQSFFLHFPRFFHVLEAGLFFRPGQNNGLFHRLSLSFYLNSGTGQDTPLARPHQTKSNNRKFRDSRLPLTGGCRGSSINAVSKSKVLQRFCSPTSGGNLLWGKVNDDDWWHFLCEPTALMDFGHYPRSINDQINSFSEARDDATVWARK